MKKIFLVSLCFIFLSATAAISQESQDVLKKYLSDMNRIFIEVEEAMRNLSMRFLTSETAAEQIAKAIEKFEPLKSPGMFASDHENMLLAFKTIKNGLELLKTDKEKAGEIARKGAALLKEAALNMKAMAEKENLIPEQPKRPETTKPILPSQTPAMIAGTSPIPSPHIASPEIDNEVMAVRTNSSKGVNIADISVSSTVSGAPVVLSAGGKIVSMKPQGDYFIIKIKTDHGNELEIDVRPSACNILKGNKLVSIDELKKGTAAHIVYTKNADRNQAAFINILRPEDIEALETP